MTFFAPFCIPFMIGAAVMFIVLLWKWGLWLYRLPLADKKRILFGLPTRRTFSSANRCSTAGSSGSTRCWATCT